MRDTPGGRYADAATIRRLEDRLADARNAEVNAEQRGAECTAALERLAKALGWEGITPDELVDEVLQQYGKGSSRG